MRSGGTERAGKPAPAYPPPMSGLELVLLITPRVVGTAVDAGKITGEMRRVTPELDEAIRRAPRPPPKAPAPQP